jgi:hypothetical protein
VAQRGVVGGAPVVSKEEEGVNEVRLISGRAMVVMVRWIASSSEG